MIDPQEIRAEVRPIELRLTEEDRYLVRVLDEHVGEIARMFGIPKKGLINAIAVRAKEHGLDLDEMTLAEARSKLGAWVRATRAAGKEKAQ